MSQVEILFLGSGDAFGSGGRFQTCFHVRSEATQFLIDCGASSLIAMRRFGVDPSCLDIILLSHLHGDHFGGLPFFVLDAEFGRRTRPLVVAGPPGVEARVRDAMEGLFPGSSGVQRRFAIEFVELAEGRETNLGPLSVIPYGVVHPSGAPSFALRVTCGGKVIAYSGDTEWTDTLVEAAHGADLFICEAYFFEKKIKYHLDYRTLMDQRTQLGCRRLILTHMSNDMLQRLQGLDVDWAEDGKRVVV
ncbi:MAG: MBL fold metallo-hydrolase [Candidatus Methylomirabilales bacterium]